jgi:hypothetical protein
MLTFVSAIDVVYCSILDGFAVVILVVRLTKVETM